VKESAKGTSLTPAMCLKETSAV